MQNRNSVHVISALIKELDIPVTGQSIREQLQKHSDIFSLRAISDSLDLWNIPNAGYQVRVDELIKTEIPLPYIACFAKGEFVLVNEVNEKQITVSNDRWDHHLLTITEFKKYYQGSILAFQKDDESGDPEYRSKRRQEIVENLRIPAIISGLVVIIILCLLLHPSYLSTFQWNNGILLFLKASGLAASILLLIQSIDANNPLIKKFCGGNSEQNCNAILSSKAAKITEWLSWSEVGFFYFAGTWLLLLFNPTDYGIIHLSAIINILCLPYTFYSIYYQWRIAKQWCIFCCTVQVILWMEFGGFLPYIISSLKAPSLRDLSYLFIAMTIPVVLWMLVKPYLIQSIELEIIKPKLYKYKYNKEQFHNSLQKEIKYALPSEEDTIVLGNREANYTVTLVSNPFCSHCSKAHQVLDDLIQIRNDIKLQLVFINRINKLELDKKVAGHFFSLQSGNNEPALKKAMSDWYRQKKKNYELWRLKYPVSENTDVLKPLSMQRDWCRIAGVTGTPTVFINGHRLPEIYEVEDIKYIL
ncbi:vitamin K epoxide reductase family protein [Mucilaginibacter lappiensis]|uniref:Putative membrane protein/glutaredoxin n=1 Tax=Mucilaginibacter lappiensis TaxID=354630 RepID=A0A841JRS5_9SPHI|nr:vitamin K epoxide reductase family protein [Mucilaginibacter lappiensis]MBB6131488.1 putative membrane protein/glutaredoxin [Mucilaginibacter lappiensis]